MFIRKAIQNNSAIILVAVLIALGLSGWILLGSVRSGSAINDQKWMLDLTNNEIVVVPRSEYSPSAFTGTHISYAGMADAGSLVDAVLIGCGRSHGRPANGMTPDELSAKGIHIAYLRRYPDNVLSLLASGQRYDGDPPQLISYASGEVWVREASPEGGQILRAMSSLCDGETPRLLRP